MNGVAKSAYRPSGMSANTWLKENGIAVKNYYYWQRRVRNEAYNQTKDVGVRPLYLLQGEAISCP